MELNNSEILENPEEPEDHWDHDSTVTMLSLYLQNVQKFSNPHIKKKNVWTDIANAVGNKTPDSCDKKFRNLKQTYIRLLRKKKKFGVTVFKWPFFELFEAIYNPNGQLQPDIQRKVKIDETTEMVAKEVEMSSSSKNLESQTNNCASQYQNEDLRRKILKRRNTEFKKVTAEMRDRQRIVEQKLDRLIKIVQESNSIQRERNRLFQQFLENSNQSD